MFPTRERGITLSSSSLALWDISVCPLWPAGLLKPVAVLGLMVAMSIAWQRVVHKVPTQVVRLLQPVWELPWEISVDVSKGCLLKANNNNILSYGIQISKKNIQTAFSQIRLYIIVFALLCVAITAYALYASYNFAREQREKIYVLDQGKSLMLALSQDASRNRPVEAREHVRRFHELFFSIAPDKDAIEQNMARAFALCDKSAFDYYKDLAEKGYFNSAISGNVNQRVEIDSIQCDFKVYPYAVTTYARVFIVRPSNVTERSLITTCTLQNAVRSDNNPQGFLMEHFVVRENQDLQTYKR